MSKWTIGSIAAITLAAMGCGDSARNVDDDGAGGGTSSSSSSGSGAGDGACDDLAEEPAVQSVEVVITNGGTVDRYLMASTMGCEVMLVERLGQSGYEKVAQSVGFQCGCECAGPGPEMPNELRRIAPGETATMTWDAREIASCSTTVDCLESYGFEGTANITYGARVPAPSGEYRLTYQLFETPPDYCFETADGYNCSGFPADGVVTSCEGELIAEAAFTLPATGDVTASVTVD